LVDVSFTDSPAPNASEYFLDGTDDDSPVIDIKVRNIGGQPAVLKRLVLRSHRAVRCGSMRMSMRLTPYYASWVGSAMPVSFSYDVSIPPPEDADGFSASVNLSQVVAPGEADRFELRLGMRPSGDTYVYLIDLEIVYDGSDRKLTSPPVAVVFPRQEFVYTATEFGSAIHKFLEETQRIRDTIDAELTARGLPVPDWQSAPPLSRGDLPNDLISVDGIGIPHGSDRIFREVLSITETAAVADPALLTSVPRALATLAEFPALRARFGVSADIVEDGQERTRQRAGKQSSELMVQILSTLTTPESRTSAIAELRRRILDSGSAAGMAGAWRLWLHQMDVGSRQTTRGFPPAPR
jgi:hypothetical protein